MMNTHGEIIDKFINAAKEYGVFMDYDGEHDFDMSIYFEDSASFISLIIAWEEALGVEFPEELLMIENYSSFERVIDIICSIS